METASIVYIFVRVCVYLSLDPFLATLPMLFVVCALLCAVALNELVRGLKRLVGTTTCG